MTNVVDIDGLPCYNLLDEYNHLHKSGVIDHPLDSYEFAQVCLNTTVDKPNDMYLGTGSLVKDWDNSYYENGNLVVPDRPVPLKESDFTELCSQFRGTLFEDVYYKLKQKYNIGRVRLMTSQPKTCLTWHRDDSHRIHYPIKTQFGCMMVFDDKPYILEQNHWYYTKTDQFHTAVNASKGTRTHLVACVIL